MKRRDMVTERLCMLCTLAGLPPMAWLELDAKAFEAAWRRRCWS